MSVSVGFPARNWRLIALGELALIAGLDATLLWQSARGTIVPRMVQVDRLGEAQAVAPAIANFRPPDPQVGWHLARFIEQVRGIASEVRRYTDADQQAEYQGDRFFEYVPALQEAEIRLPAQ